MNNNMVTTQNVTMTSIDFIELVINPARLEAGEKYIRHSDFLKRVKDEIGTEGVYEIFVHPQNGQTYQQAILNQDQMMLVGMRESKAVRKSVLAKLKLLSAPPQPALPTTYLEALEKLLETEKEKIAISHERDHAIKTKAEISDKKTATAMATASVLSRKVKTLESKLQDVGNYQSLIAAQLPQRVETEINDNAQTWRVLVKMSKDMNLPPKKVIDARYGEVNTYHVEVINKFIEEYL